MFFISLKSLCATKFFISFLCKAPCILTFFPSNIIESNIWLSQYLIKWLPCPSFSLPWHIRHKDAKFKFYYSTCLNFAHYQAKDFCLEFWASPSYLYVFDLTNSFLTYPQSRITARTPCMYEGYISKSQSKCLGPMHIIKPYVFIYVLFSV